MMVGTTVWVSMNQGQWIIQWTGLVLSFLRMRGWWLKRQAFKKHKKIATLLEISTNANKSVQPSVAKGMVFRSSPANIGLDVFTSDNGLVHWSFNNQLQVIRLQILQSCEAKCCPT
jgi:hypothetical protein